MDKKPQNLEQINLDALRGGDRAEFARLVDATSEQVYRTILRIVNDPQDAEDALQETYLKAMRALPGFEGRSSLSTWLYRIAANEALMILRRRRPVAAIEDERDDDEEGVQAPVQIVDFSSLPERELLSAEGRRALERAIANLPPGLRAVFVLRDIDDLSIRETAEALNLTQVNVKTRLLRARLKLREELSGYYHLQEQDAREEP